MAEPASVEAIRDRFLEFLEYPHEQDDEGNAVSPYLTQLLLMPEANKTTLYVDFADLNDYDVDLADLIKVLPHGQVYQCCCNQCVDRSRCIVSSLSRVLHQRVRVPQLLLLLVP